MKYGENAIKEAELERWENNFPGRDYRIELCYPEFTCKCPRSGYPDFAVIKIHYVPDRYVAELKSLKLFLNSFRDKSISHEDSINTIYESLHKLLEPRFLEVVGDFNPRGNLKTVIRVSTD